MSDTKTLPEEDTEITEFDGKAHFARTVAIISGGPVVALCGKKYQPRITGEAVLKLPVCATCRELMDILHMMDPNCPKADL